MVSCGVLTFVEIRLEVEPNLRAATPTMSTMAADQIKPTDLLVQCCIYLLNSVTLAKPKD